MGCWSAGLLEQCVPCSISGDATAIMLLGSDFQHFMVFGRITVTLKILGSLLINIKPRLLIAKHFLLHYCMSSSLHATNFVQQGQKREILVSRFASSSLMLHFSSLVNSWLPVEKPCSWARHEQACSLLVVLINSFQFKQYNIKQ